LIESVAQTISYHVEGEYDHRDASGGEGKLGD
jgi:redox-sensitive bicupin YhaK (pirin superfamily)